MGDYEIRPLETIDELRACVALQEETWGEGFSEQVPPAILKVAQILGGVAAGAYDAGGILVGFVFGMTGLKDGHLVHWSDMLAVRAGLRDSGLGTRLKAYQREQVLALGVETMHWTFDPLQARNAHVNFAKLGIVVREYVEDMYGDTDSPLHAGIGTDRFIAVWELASERVQRRLAGERGPDDEAAHGGVHVLGAEQDGDVPRPGTLDLSCEADRLLVAIPSDIGRVMRESMELAGTWRLASRRVLGEYLARGYEVRELLRGEPVAHYLLTRLGEPR